MRNIFFSLILILFSCSNADDIETNLLHRARTAYLIGENITSEDIYKKYLQSYPTGKFRYEAWRRIYDITVNLKYKKKDALPIIDAMILEFSNDKSLMIEILELSAQVYTDLLLTDKAIDIWGQYLDIVGNEQDNNLARLQLSKLYASINQYEMALKTLENFKSTSDTNTITQECELQEAKILVKLNLNDKACKILNKIITESKTYNNIYYESVLILAEIYEIQNNKQLAKNLYKNLLSYYPSHNVIKSRIDSLN